MSPTGPNYPSANSQSGGTLTWTNPANAYIEDGLVAYAQCGPGSGGSVNQLKLTGFGFNIPSTAVIDGIKLEIKVQTTLGSTATDLNTNGVYLLYNGGNTAYTNTPNSGQLWPAAGLTWLTYGNNTSLWGRNWTPSDINNTNFGSSLSAAPPSGTSQINVDAVRITIYWHTAPTKIPRNKYFQYKVYDSSSGSFLGNIPNVTSTLQIAQDVNTGGSQITVNAGVSADVSALATSSILDESGNAILDENNNATYDDGAINYVGVGGGTALLRNGNAVQVWEYSYYYPNGKCLFKGNIGKVTANFGGDTGDNDTQLIIYSDGIDLDNHLVKAGSSGYTLDQSQTSQNSSGNISTDTSGKLQSWNYYGQTFTIGAGVTNVGAVNLLLSGTATVSVSLYSSPASSSPLATASQNVSVGNATEIQFTFPLHVTVTPGNQYFFTVTVPDGQSITIYYSNSNPYSGGQLYNNNFSGISGGSYIAVSGSDMYFKTYSTTGSTTASFSNVDPAAMLKTMIDDYTTEGGKVNYSSSSIVNTGVSVNYGVNTTTTYSGIKGALSLAPSTYYFYVDLGQDILYFKPTSTTADIILTKGIHINKLQVVNTIEYLVNMVYVVGGPDSANVGYNIFTADSDQKSISNYGTRLRVHTDSNITDKTTAHIVGQNILNQSKNEQYQTTVTIPSSTMDITLVKPGMIIGFNGFGSYVDYLLAEVVHLDLTPGYVTCQLGILPKQTTVAVEQVIRGIVSLSTVATNTNPSAPS